MINGLMIGGLLKIAAVLVLLGIIYLLKDRNYTGNTSRFRFQPWDLTAAYKVYIPVQISIFVFNIGIQIQPLSTYPRAISFSILYIPIIIVFLLFFIFVKRPFNVRWNSFGINFEAFVKKTIPLIVLLVVAYSIYAMRREYKIVSNVLGIKMLFVPILILGSMAEELLFRGVMWSAFARKMNLTMAALISSICWSVWHYWSSLPENIGLVLIGLFLSWTYYWSRTILVPMVLHSVTNAMKFLIYF